MFESIWSIIIKSCIAKSCLALIYGWESEVLSGLTPLLCPRLAVTISCNIHLMQHTLGCFRMTECVKSNCLRTKLMIVCWLLLYQSWKRAHHLSLPPHKILYSITNLDGKTSFCVCCSSVRKQKSWQNETSNKKSRWGEKKSAQSKNLVSDSIFSQEFQHQWTCET